MTDINYAERTVNPYETEGPGDGRTWHEYFAQMRKDRADAAEEYVAPSSQVTTKGHEIPLDELPKNIASIVKVAQTSFIVKARHSQTFTEGAVFKTGDRAGEKRDDKLEDHYALGFFEDHEQIVAEGVWISGTFSYGKYLSERFDKVTEFKKRLKND